MRMDNLFESLEYLKTLFGGEITLNQLLLFIKVCTAEGISMPDLGDSLSIAQNTVSRNVKSLGRYRDRNTGRIEGYDLVFTTQDLEERRRFVLFLTEKGRRVRQELDTILAGEGGG